MRHPAETLFHSWSGGLTGTTKALASRTQAGPRQLILKMERGEIFLPKYDTQWRPAFERDLLAWTGAKRQPSDQIDAAAYAAIIASQHSPGPIRIQPIVHRS